MNKKMLLSFLFLALVSMNQALYGISFHHVHGPELKSVNGNFSDLSKDSTIAEFRNELVERFGFDDDETSRMIICFLGGGDSITIDDDLKTFDDYLPRANWNEVGITVFVLPRTFSVKVKWTEGDVNLVIEGLNENATVGELKNKIAEQLDIPPQEQTLFVGMANKLENDQSLLFFSPLLIQKYHKVFLLTYITPQWRGIIDQRMDDFGIDEKVACLQLLRAIREMSQNPEQWELNYHGIKNFDDLTIIRKHEKMLRALAK